MYLPHPRQTKKRPPFFCPNSPPLTQLARSFNKSQEVPFAYHESPISGILPLPHSLPQEIRFGEHRNDAESAQPQHSTIIQHRLPNLSRYYLLSSTDLDLLARTHSASTKSENVTYLNHGGADDTRRRPKFCPAESTSRVVRLHHQPSTITYLTCLPLPFPLDKAIRNLAYSNILPPSYLFQPRLHISECETLGLGADLATTS